MSEPLELVIIGKVPSKKNSYTPKANGRGMFKNRDLQAAIDALALQVPGWMRDQRLRHPRIDFYFTVTADGQGADRDSKATTLLDILVTMRVLTDDCIRECNGLMVIHPATVGDCHQSRIIITPMAAEVDGGSAVTRYVTRRKARIPLAALAGHRDNETLPLDPLDDLEDFPEEEWDE